MVIFMTARDVTSSKIRICECDNCFVIGKNSLQKKFCHKQLDTFVLLQRELYTRDLI